MYVKRLRSVGSCVEFVWEFKKMVIFSNIVVLEFIVDIKGDILVLVKEEFKVFEKDEKDIDIEDEEDFEMI